MTHSMLDPNNHEQMIILQECMEIARQTGYVNGRMSRLPFLAALLAIRDMPMSEQDNMLSANMRKIASDALAGDGA